MPRYKNGITSYTTATLPASLPAGTSVVVDGVKVEGDADGKVIRSDKPFLYHPISSRNTVHNNFFAMTALSRGYRTYRKLFVPCDVKSIRLIYANKYVAQNGVETDNPSTPTIKIGVMREGDTEVTPVFFNGQRLKVMGSGEVFISDPIALPLTPDDTALILRQWVSVPSIGDKICTSFQNNTATAIPAEYFRSEGASVDFVDNLAYSAANAYGPSNEFGPFAVVGQAADGRIMPSLVISGSSSATGVGDTQESPNWVPGYLARRANMDRIPYINISSSGETLTNFLAMGAASRKSLVAMCNCTHVVQTYGSNDIGGAASLATMKERLMKLKNWFDRVGLISAFCTYTPVTTSTDAWATAANQTVASTVRHELSEWLRNESGFNVIDLEKYSDNGFVTSGVYDGKWRVDLGVPTLDGLHGTNVIHAAISEGISFSNLVKF